MLSNEYSIYAVDSDNDPCYHAEGGVLRAHSTSIWFLILKEKTDTGCLIQRPTSLQHIPSDVLF